MVLLYQDQKLAVDRRMMPAPALRVSLATTYSTGWKTPEGGIDLASFLAFAVQGGRERIVNTKWHVAVEFVTTSDCVCSSGSKILWTK